MGNLLPFWCIISAEMDDFINIKFVFEGPFDSLCTLSGNKTDIYDIPIALITSQYLHYIEMMKELNSKLPANLF
jgi:chromatin segregation and condensation protein Rec8/ScpA/Scc1 (kleisin family)